MHNAILICISYVLVCLISYILLYLLQAAAGAKIVLQMSRTGVEWQGGTCALIYRKVILSLSLMLFSDAWFY